MSKKAQVQETCSCGAGVIADKKFVLEWRKSHLHGEVRDVQSEVGFSAQEEPTEPAEPDENLMGWPPPIKPEPATFKTGFTPA